MNSVIKNIQIYDRAMFAMENKIDELLSKNKAQDISIMDEKIEETPSESRENAR